MSQQIEQKMRRGVALHKSNPFISVDLVGVKTRQITNQKSDSMVTNNVADEAVAGVSGFWQSQKVDNTKFIKLYVDGMRALKGLSSAGMKVFEVLCSDVQKTINRDKIYMGFSLVEQDANPMGLATYKRGMSELISKGFLAATPVQGWFWLNPDFMWNGDRLAFVRSYYRAPSKPHATRAQQPNQLGAERKKAGKKEEPKK